MNKMRIVPAWQTYLPHILIIACMWLLAMSMDYADAAASAEAQAQDMSAAMAACLRGEWQGTASDGVQIKCYPAETFNPATQRSGS